MKGYTPRLPEKYPKLNEIYKHYKGDLYQVIGLAIHSNDDIWMVVYRSMYENADAEMFTRPLDEWYSEIKWNGELLQRFTLAN